jgi:hypothetical protein
VPGAQPKKKRYAVASNMVKKAQERAAHADRRKTKGRGEF